MIAAAVETVEQAVGDRGLAGLVNNAGIVRPGPLEFQPMDDFRTQLEVNLFGHVAVTQAFLPLIRKGKGRLVNVGSIGGRLVLPLHGAYSASKFAMEAVTDAFRLELREWNIHVSLVDPGGSASAIFGKTIAAIDDMQQGLHDRGIHLYDDDIASVRALVQKTADEAAPADRVAKAVANALTAKKPKTRYLAGKDAARSRSDGQDAPRSPEGPRGRARGRHLPHSGLNTDRHERAGDATHEASSTRGCSGTRERLVRFSSRRSASAH